jgi:hypothetical protein
MKEELKKTEKGDWNQNDEFSSGTACAALLKLIRTSPPLRYIVGVSVFGTRIGMIFAC